MINFINFLLPTHIENLLTNLLPVKWELNVWIVIITNIYNFHQERFIMFSLDRNIYLSLPYIEVGKNHKTKKEKCLGSKIINFTTKLLTSCSSISAKREYQITLFLGEASNIKH